MAWIYAWVVHCFAGDAYEHRTRSIKFAYFFVILSFVAVSIMIANIGRARSFGVVEGCISSAEETSFLPIRCDHPARLPQLERKMADSAQDKGGGSGAGIALVTTQTATFEERRKNALLNHNFHHLLNIGGRLDELGVSAGQEAYAGCPAKMIHGGLPVPVYFILLALIGAAISLARQVPTIQRRSEDAYVGTAAEPRLAPGEVRELLAFQILQFVSAPFLAVAAYHTLKPESLATTVAIGFLTGFASERILSVLSVRLKDMNDKSDATTVLSGSLRGEVRVDGKAEAGVRVAIEGVDQIKPVVTDSLGAFTLMAVPVSAAPYMLRATFTKDGRRFAGTREVSVPKPTEAKAGIIELGPAP